MRETLAFIWLVTRGAWHDLLPLLISDIDLRKNWKIATEYLHSLDDKLRAMSPKQREQVCRYYHAASMASLIGAITLISTKDGILRFIEAPFLVYLASKLFWEGLNFCKEAS